MEAGRNVLENSGQVVTCSLLLREPAITGTCKIAVKATFCKFCTGATSISTDI